MENSNVATPFDIFEFLNWPSRYFSQIMAALTHAPHWSVCNFVIEEEEEEEEEIF